MFVFITLLFRTLSGRRSSWRGRGLVLLGRQRVGVVVGPDGGAASCTVAEASMARGLLDLPLLFQWIPCEVEGLGGQV